MNLINRKALGLLEWKKVVQIVQQSESLQVTQNGVLADNIEIEVHSGREI